MSANEFMKNKLPYRMPDITELRTPEENKMANALRESMQRACDEAVRTFKENTDCLVYRFLKETGAKADDIVICRGQQDMSYWIELKSKRVPTIATPDEIVKRDELILVMRETLVDAKDKLTPFDGGELKTLLAKINLILEATECGEDE